MFGGMLHICRSGLLLSFLAAVASEDLQNYKAFHLIDPVKSSELSHNRWCPSLTYDPSTALSPLK